MGLYISITYAGDWSGEDTEVPTGFETTGALYRALSGQERMYSYRALGRCTGRMYVDGPDGRAVQHGWVFESRERDGSRRESWVSVHTAPRDVTYTYHPATFGRAQ